MDATMGPATRDRVATEWRPTVTFVISVSRSCFLLTPWVKTRIAKTIQSQKNDLRRLHERFRRCNSGFDSQDMLAYNFVHAKWMFDQSHTSVLVHMTKRALQKNLGNR